MTHMIDIAAFADDIARAENVLARVAGGVPAGREMHADEVLPVLRALHVWRAAALAAMDYATAKGTQAMLLDGEE